MSLQCRGFEAEKMFENVVVNVTGADRLCGTSKPPRYQQVGLCTATQDEDNLGGVDYWLYMSFFYAQEWCNIPWDGGFLPLDITINGQIANEKHEKCISCGVIPVLLPADTLTAAAENGSSTNSQRIWETVVKAIKSALKEMDDRGIEIISPDNIQKRINAALNGGRTF